MFVLYTNEISWPVWCPLFCHLHNCECFNMVNWGPAVSSCFSSFSSSMCYGSALIRYQITPLYLPNPLRVGCGHSLFSYCTSKVSVPKSSRIHFNARHSGSFIVLLSRLNTVSQGTENKFTVTGTGQPPFDITVSTDAGSFSPSCSGQGSLRDLWSLARLRLISASLFWKRALSVAPPLPKSCATVLRLFVKWK